MSNSQILIFDQKGLNPVEVDGQILRMSWHDHEVSEARLSIPLVSPKLNQDLLRPGSMVYIQTQGLQDWTGVVMLPQAWYQDHVEITAKSMMYYLARRYPWQSYEIGMTPGATAMRMLRGAKRRGFLPVYLDRQNVRTDGPVLKDVLDMELSILENLTGLAERTGFEFWLSPQLVNGSLQAFFHWQKRKEVLGSPIEVGEGGNAFWGIPSMTCSGELVTAWYVSEEEKQRADGSRVFLQTSLPRVLYGHWEGVLKVSRINAGKARSREFIHAVQEYGKPEVRYRMLVEIGRGALSAEIAPGSLHLLHGPDTGFFGGKRGTSTKVRVLVMSYSSGTGLLDVVAQEWKDAEDPSWVP